MSTRWGMLPSSIKKTVNNIEPETMCQPGEVCCLVQFNKSMDIEPETTCQPDEVCCLETFKKNCLHWIWNCVSTRWSMLPSRVKKTVYIEPETMCQPDEVCYLFHYYKPRYEMR